MFQQPKVSPLARVGGARWSTRQKGIIVLVCFDKKGKKANIISANRKVSWGAPIKKKGTPLSVDPYTLSLSLSALWCEVLLSLQRLADAIKLAFPLLVAIFLFEGIAVDHLAIHVHAKAQHRLSLANAVFF